MVLSVAYAVTYAECHCAVCHYDEYHYAECHYAECHYAECRGAVLTPRAKMKEQGG
jgi:hypothetical protein